MATSRGSIDEKSAGALEIAFRVLRSEAVAPRTMTAGAAGADLSAAEAVEYGLINKIVASAADLGA